MGLPAPRRVLIRFYCGSKDSAISWQSFLLMRTASGCHTLALRKDGPCFLAVTSKRQAHVPPFRPHIPVVGIRFRITEGHRLH